MSDFLGAAVVDGEVRFFSPSSLEKGDPRAGGCNLKWWFRYIRRIKEADTDSKDSGRKLHDELARYERTGDRSLSALAMSGLHMVPTGPDLLVEVPIHTVTTDKSALGGSRIASLLYADGVPVIGYVDHVNRRGLNMGAEDISDTNDPPGTVEIIDWKWKGNGAKAEYFLTRDQLVLDTQLSGYGLGIGRYFGATHVRLGHGYFPATRGRPRKVTKLHVLQDCANNWKYVDGLARHLRGIARESNPERIEGNKNACESYGGCPYRDQCPTYKTASSADVFGATASQEIKMGLNFGQPQIAQPGSTPQDAAALAAEEAHLRMTAAQQQVIPGFVDACTRIQNSGRGFPPLGGAAAQMYAAAGGQSIAPGTAWAGQGELARMPTPITEPIHVLQLANEIAPVQQQAPAPQPVAPPTPVATPAPATAPWLPQQPASQPVTTNTPWGTVATTTATSILPPDAPVSQPHLAAKPVEGFTLPTPPSPQQIMQTAAAQPPALAFTFPPTQQPQGPTGAAPIQAAPVPPPSSTGATASPAAPATSTEAPKTRGRKPKPEGYRDTVPANTTPALSPFPDPTIETRGLAVFVDCTPNVDAESLNPYVDKIVGALVARFCAAPCLPDLRSAPKDGPLGYGGWKGAIRAMVLEQPPPTAAYHLRVRGDEYAEEVAAAMLTVCNRTGGLYVR